MTTPQRSALSDAESQAPWSLTNPLFCLYDSLFWGEGLNETDTRDLRALARIFDLNAGSSVPLPKLWGQLRPLVVRSSNRS